MYLFVILDPHDFPAPPVIKDKALIPNLCGGTILSGLEEIPLLKLLS
jgi:hypothetical protein